MAIENSVSNDFFYLLSSIVLTFFDCSLPGVMSFRDHHTMAFSMVQHRY